MNTPTLRVLPYLILLLPFDLLVAGFLLLAVVVRRFVPGVKIKTGGQSPPLQKTSTTIQILNWDGKHLLEECLPSVCAAVQRAGGNHSILVVDNGSTDGSVAFVRERFPDVRVLELDRNYGFVGGNNRGVKSVDTDIVVLLNNDMIVDADFLLPLLAGFADESVFAVTSQIFFQDPSKRREETGKTSAVFDAGFFALSHDAIDSATERKATLPVFWAGGGSCAFDRLKYLEIGGFDDLYKPFYVEDTDISYNAWKRGWKCLLAPASHVVHKHRSSSRRFGHGFVDNTIRRNIYLFIWKNVTDLGMVIEHIANLPRIHSRAMSLHGPQFELRAYARALARLPLALLKNISNRRNQLLSDRDVLARSRQ